MNTQGINIVQNFTQEKATTEPRTGWLEKQAVGFEKNRFALMSLFITLQSCIGGIAAMYLLEKDANDGYLMICAAITMGANALLIAQAGAKTCIISIYANILINTLFILLYL